MGSPERSRARGLSETELAHGSPTAVRLAEAEYFLNQFRVHCGPPSDSYFLMVTYADAFLVVLASIEAFVAEDARARLYQLPEFRFVKTLRNITVHHDVLAAPGTHGKFGRPFRRIVEESVGVPGNPSSSKLMAVPERFRAILSELLDERPKQRTNIEGALAFLDAHGAQDTEVPLEDWFARALATVASEIAREDASEQGE